MEVIKKGYQQTEIGVIPKDWKVITYDDAFHFLSTASYSRAQISENGEVGYIHYGDIHTRWKHFLDINEEQLPFINKEQLKTYSLLKEGDVVMADASEDYKGIGESVEVKSIGSKNIISGLHTFLLRGKEGVFINGFKGYIHSNKAVKNQFDRLATGLKVYGVTKTNLKTVKIPLPPLPEQKAIAEVLSDMDNLITALERQIEKKRLVKQGAMQRLLTAGEDWEVRTLGECLTNNPSYGINAAAVKYNLNLPTYLRITDISENGRFISKNKVSVDNSQSSDFYLEKDDLVFARTGASVGKSYLHHPSDGKLVFAGFLIRVRANPIILNATYLKFYVQTSEYWNWIKVMSMRSGQPGINGLELSQLKISLPSLPEQTRIATILSDMDGAIAGLEKQLEKYRAVKVGLMQELLSGRKRLIDN